jgi:hypothetical protein
MLEGSVMSVPDEKGGERPEAFVDRRPRTDVSEADLMAHVRLQIARFKAPKAVEFVDALPRTSSGKFHKFELRAKEGPATPAVSRAEPTGGQMLADDSYTEETLHRARIGRSRVARLRAARNHGATYGHQAVTRKGSLDWEATRDGNHDAGWYTMHALSANQYLLRRYPDGWRLVRAFLPRRRPGGTDRERGPRLGGRGGRAQDPAHRAGMGARADPGRRDHPLCRGLIRPDVESRGHAVR